MGLLKKKKKNKEPAPPLPIMELDLAMEGKTSLVADEKGEFCYALFQTDKPVAPAEWAMLAQRAREGCRFTLRVTEVVDEPEK